MLRAGWIGECEGPRLINTQLGSGELHTSTILHFDEIFGNPFSDHQ